MDNKSKSDGCIVKPDRGTVKRITLDLLYPNGQLKTVVIGSDSEENYGTFSAIFFDDHGIKNFLLNNDSAIEMKSEDIEHLWNNIDKGENPQAKPAIMIVNTDGRVIAKCGAHRSVRSMDDIVK